MDLPVIDIAHEDLEGEEIFEESVFAPFGRFFDDDLFMLIYTSQGVLDCPGIYDTSQPHAAARSNASGLTPPR